MSAAPVDPSVTVEVRLDVLTAGHIMGVLTAAEQLELHQLLAAAEALPTSQDVLQ